MLAIQLRKWIRKGYVHNVYLFEPIHARSSLDAGQDADVALITGKEQRIYRFTSSAVVTPEGRAICYDDVRACHWISETFPFDVSDADEMIRAKRDYYDTLILETKSREQVKLSGLDQAVFPILHFFQWHLSGTA